MERILSTGCVWKLVSARALAYAEYYAHYKAGHLIDPGGIDDQPGWYCAGMRVMHNRLVEYESEAQQAAAEQHKQWQ